MWPRAFAQKIREEMKITLASAAQNQSCRSKICADFHKYIESGN
jgi:hypothetical protein